MKISRNALASIKCIQTEERWAFLIGKPSRVVMPLRALSVFRLRRLGNGIKGLNDEGRNALASIKCIQTNMGMSERKAFEAGS